MCVGSRGLHQFGDAAVIKRRKPLARSKSSTLAKNRELRQAVLERDPECQMLRRACFTTPWVLCQRPSIDAAHIFARVQCGRAKYDLDVCVGSCRGCHNMWHAHDPNVRFSLDQILRAEKAIAQAGNKTALRKR